MTMITRAMLSGFRIGENKGIDKYGVGLIVQ